MLSCLDQIFHGCTLHSLLLISRKYCSQLNPVVLQVPVGVLFILLGTVFLIKV